MRKLTQTKCENLDFHKSTALHQGLRADTTFCATLFVHLILHVSQDVQYVGMQQRFNNNI